MCHQARQTMPVMCPACISWGMVFGHPLRRSVRGRVTGHRCVSTGFSVSLRHWYRRCHPGSRCHPVAHVTHREYWSGIHAGHRCAQSSANGQRPSRVARPVHGLGEDREGLPASGLDDHVECFGHAYAKFIHCHWMNMLPIRRYHRHPQARNSNVEIGHRRPVDDAEPDTFSRREETCPIPLGCLAV